jgi:hypothetical protein
MAGGNKITANAAVQPFVQKCLASIETMSLSRRPARDLKAGDYEYQVELVMGPQKIPMAMKRSVKAEGGNWRISDEMETMMGGATMTMERVK